MPQHPGPRREWVVAAVCIAAGLFFFSSLANLWPLAKLDLTLPASRVHADASGFLESRGFDLSGYRSAKRLRVATPALDYVEREFDRGQVQEWIAAGLPLFYYHAQFKKRGEIISYGVDLHPAAGIIGWTKSIPEDYPAARIPVEQARLLALRALAGPLELDPVVFEERSAASVERSESLIHTFGFERTISETPELREKITITVCGDEIIGALRRLRLPAEADRAARAAQAPGVALETVGFALLATSAVSAFFIFLRRLRSGVALLGRAAVWPAVVFVCLTGTFALETANLFLNWEPLWPQWISNLRYLVFGAIRQAWVLVLLLAVVSAGDALDRESGAGRGWSLWSLGRGRLLDAAVARASGRGFLIGLLCGGVMAAAVILLEWVAGSATAIQPRGFFFYTLNSASPPATSLLFFFGVALAEELGYRFFGGSWMLALTGRKWVAILLPALIYGLSHTRMDFLPPAGPFWARPLVLTLVGIVWGWAFFRYDALTVVLSHLTADLFIFNWPRLASGKGGVVVASVLTLCVPLLPLLLQPLRASRDRLARR